MSVVTGLPRPVRVTLVLALAAAFGVGLYAWLGTLVNTATLGGKVADPTQSSALVGLPGTVVVAQSGGLYALRGGHFTRLTSGGGWTQPAVTPDHRHLVAVRRQSLFSDLYELGTGGAVERQLTDNASSQVDLNHWSFYPSVSPDGASVYYSYDRKYFAGSFLVDLSVYRMALAGSQRQAQAWSTPNQGTGGDLQATGLASGGLIYAKTEIDGASNQVLSHVWYQRGQRTRGAALSPDGQRCQQPALSPNGSEVAMICSGVGSATAQLEVAPLDLAGITLGPPKVLATGLPAAPAWAPDGKSLVYFAPAGDQSGQTGQFQLYTVAIPTSGAPAPRAVTAGDAFDSTAAPVWYP
jgi:Tol biopolymer transport system component